MTYKIIYNHSKRGSLFKIHFFRLNACSPFITAKMLLLLSSTNDFTNDDVITV